jgi:hypothetical protein
MGVPEQSSIEKPYLGGSYPTKIGVRGESSPGTPVFRIKNLHKWGVPGQSSMSTPDFRRSSQKFSKHLPKMGFRGETCPGIHHFMRFYPRKTVVKQRFSCKNPYLSIKNSISNTKFDQHSPFWGI